MQFIPRKFLEFICAESRQKPKWIIQIVNEVLLGIFCTILCDKHQFNSFTFLRVHPLLVAGYVQAVACKQLLWVQFATVFFSHKFFFFL